MQNLGEKIGKGLPIHIGDLTINVVGYEFSDERDYWDGNWLIIDATCCDANKHVSISHGPCLRTDEIHAFLDQLNSLLEGKSDFAKLDPMEPYIGVDVTSKIPGEAVSVSVRIMPAKKFEHSTFQFKCSYVEVEKWVMEIEIVLNSFPIKGRI